MADGHSPEECLGDYPEHRDRLLPLLEAAHTTLSAAASVTPGEKARERGRARLRERIETGFPPDAGSRWWRVRVPRPVVVPMAAAMVVALLMLGGGSIAAAVADDSVPGDRLYWAKRTKENIMLTFSRSDAGRALAHAELAGVRGEEMRKLIEQGRIAAAERQLAAVRRQLGASAEYAGVAIAVNRIEMPSAHVSMGSGKEFVTLVVTLERDGDLLRVNPIAVDSPELRDQRLRIERIKRAFELSYWILVSALYPDATSGPLWRTETIGSRALQTSGP